MKIKFLACIFFILTYFMPCSGFELDLSVDDEIKQKYNSSKLEQDVLPPLPVVLNEKSKKNATVKCNSTNLMNKNHLPEVPSLNIETNFSPNFEKVHTEKKLNGGDTYTEIKIPKGTTFKVRSKTNVSDRNSSGDKMTFVSTVPVTKRYVSFPVGTTFKGYVEDSHRPNFAGNGGLLKLKINTVSNNGISSNLDAKVVRANNRIIFLNNIKGKRGYIKGVASSISQGENFYKKTRKTSARWSNNPIGAFVSPLPTIVGVVGYGANLAISPVKALWSKGSPISLPAGTDYTIKLRNDSYIYK